MSKSRILIGIIAVVVVIALVGVIAIKVLDRKDKNNAAENTMPPVSNTVQNDAANTVPDNSVNTVTPTPSQNSTSNVKTTEGITYKNKVITYKGTSGTTYSIGTNAGDSKTGLYIDIAQDKCDCAGFYFTMSYAGLWMSTRPNLKPNAGNYFLHGLIMEDGIPMGGSAGDDFALLWFDPEDPTENEYTFTVKAVDIKYGELIDIFKVTISSDYKNKVCEIASVTPADELLLGNMEKKERDEILSRAADFAFIRAGGAITSKEAWEREIWDTAVCEHVTMPYHGHVIECGTNTTYMITQKWPKVYDNMYAVTMRVPKFGYITVYVARTGWVDGLDMTLDMFQTSDLRPYMAFAYSPINTRDETTIIPAGYKPWDGDRILRIR